MRPILFNTEMVKAIQEDRKTVTRRVVKPQPRKNIDQKIIFEGGRFRYSGADTIDTLAAQLAALRAKSAEKDREIEQLTKKATLNAFIKYAMKRACEELVDTEVTLSRMEAERDKHKRALYLSIEAHSVDPRQIERLARHYLEQASGAQREEGPDGL